MTLFSARSLLGPALILAGLSAGGCTQLRSHQGYVIDADLVNSVQAGVDTRQSVLQVLGKPTFTSEFNQGDWYYVSRDARNFAYNNPHVKSQTTLRISFDGKGVVTGIRKTGAEQIASISPMKKTTPTLGRKSSFFSELFGNIGTVGAVGGGGGQQGGGRDRP
ncbi:outer membrane protein assembly factor BamE [Sphingomonas sp. H39-1-10]|uniref:outer membrane protein assembly factor BamE n=1 Tax=Sphingomonas TaxID=13687 RepID=UPI000888807A|nr:MULTISPECIES: outer membrane protein assembly factor BamE [Sphingomonas]MDF0488090.1 outer membrane protein assembly factor BamE [Sphingomonas pollutisoli]SDA33392.1 Outer membrane protein assembly factor BamE, lipoprotein component of the BamABCDE complex [Sphingomonas sp. NFR15]